MTKTRHGRAFACCVHESNRIYDCRLTPDEYEKLPLEEKEHYAECSECGEIFDRRSLDEVLFHHADHKHPPDI